MKRLDPTDSRVQKAIALYKSGKAVKPICKELKMDGQALREVLISEGLLRTRAEAVRRGKGIAEVKDDAFDILTPEALYWIGFLYADGHIEKDPRTVVTLTLQEKDIDHLRKFNTFLGNGLNIRDVTPKSFKPAPGQVNIDGKYFRISFSSKQAHTRLKELGFTHNKTLKITPHWELVNSVDFWRGVVDGDGWVCYTNEKRYGGRYNRISLGMSGTIETLTSFVEFLSNNGVNTRTTPNQRSEIWELNIHSGPAKAALHLLYKDASVYLDRKYEKYLKEFAEPETVAA